jgi:repressor of nif and glnA expression
MSDEQILREIAKRHEALREATLRYHVQDSTSRGFKRKVLAGLE